MTFIEMKTKVADYLNRSDLTAIIPDFINMAMHKIEGRVNWRGMITRGTGTFTSSVDTMSIPTRYKDTKALIITDSNGTLWRLQKDTYKNLIRNHSGGSNVKGRPYEFAMLEGVNFYVRPFPDLTYTYEHLYYVRSADLSGDNDTNYLLTDMWELLLYGSLMDAWAYQEDTDEIMKYKSLYDNAFENYRDKKDNEAMYDILGNELSFDGLNAIHSNIITGV